MHFTWGPAKPNQCPSPCHRVRGRLSHLRWTNGRAHRRSLRQLRVYAIGLINGIEITVIYTDRDDGERHLMTARRPNRMNGDISGTTSTTKPKTNWPRLQRMSD